MKNVKNVLRLLKITFSISPQIILLNFIHNILKAIIPMVSIVLSANILGSLIAQLPYQEVAKWAILLISLNLITSLILAFLRKQITVLNVYLKDELTLKIGQKIMSIPYQELESPKLLDLKQQALMPILEWGTYEFIMEEFLPVVIGGAVTIISTVFIAFEYSFLLLILSTIAVAINLGLSRIKNKRLEKVMTIVGLVERKLVYYTDLVGDFSSGKDIRIFGMHKIISEKIKKLNDEELTAFTELFDNAAKMDFWMTVITQIQIYIIYFLVVVDVIKKAISVEKFFEVTGLFINFGNAVFALLNAFVNLESRGNFLQKFIEFDDLLATAGKPGAVVPPTPPQSIELKNICFSYGDKEIIKDISFSIRKGERVAFVGENGSGKTTLVKLISGLLSPSQGNILINGEPLDSTTQHITSIYQDFKLFSFTIYDNIVLSYERDFDVADILETVGMRVDVDKLKHKDQTFIYKDFEGDGIELSGGQGQKISIARALYKDSGIIILDEPTAALDPKAEYEMFTHFQNITKGKTAILVSHRLSSCRFCDTVMVVDNGRIVETGTHETLMQRPSKYKEMFEAQAQFYQ